METIDISNSRPIAGFPDYLIARDGTLYSRRLTGNWRKRRPGHGKDGYWRAPLSNDTERRTCYVHRLVAEAWVANPANKPEINHVNHVKADNRAENLEWVTHAENLAAARAHHGKWDTNNGKAIIATPTNGGQPAEWTSARAWAISTGNHRKAANVCRCLRNGRAAYGYFWRFKG